MSIYLTRTKQVDDEIVCAVDLGGLYQGIRDGFEEVAHNQDVKHAHKPRNQHGEGIVAQVQVFRDQDIPGHQAAAEQGGEVKEKGELVAPGEIPAVQHIGGHGGDQQGKGGAHYGQHRGDLVGPGQGHAPLQEQPVGFQRPFLWDQAEAVPVNGFLRGEGACHDHQKRDQADNRQQGDHCVRDGHKRGPVPGGAYFHRPYRLFFVGRHASIIPFLRRDAAGGFAGRGRPGEARDQRSLPLEQGVFLIDQAREAVYGHDDDQVQDGLVRARRRGHSEIGGLHQGAVDVGVDHVGHLEEHAVVADHIVEQLEIALADAPHRQQRQGDDGGQQAGNGDDPDFLEGVSPVDIRGLIDFRVDPHDGGKVQHNAVAQALPGVEDDQDPGPHPGIGVDVHPLHAQAGEDGVERAELVVEDVVHKRADYHHGNEVGQEHHGLGHLFEQLQPHLRQHDGHQHLQGCAHEQKGHVVEDGVAGEEPGVPGAEEETEIFKPRPGAGENALGVVEPLEGQDDAGHGEIVENQEIQHGGQDHQEHDPVLPDLSQEPAGLFGPCRQCAHPFSGILLPSSWDLTQASSASIFRYPSSMVGTISSALP